jgi:DNA-binding transcriptional LysR family regulator
MDLAGVDLNLLVVFDALMAERHVTRAGERIGLSQPAVSASLKRLRHLLKDDLFIRRSDEMQPTRKAQELAVPLRQALTQIQAALEPQSFDPAVSQRLFKLATNDFAASILLPSLGARLSREAPGIDLRVIYADDSLGMKLLDEDTIDIAIAPFEQYDLQFERKHLLEPAGFLCVMRKGHPLEGQPLTLETFAEAPQLLISRTGDASGFVDEILAEVGLKRRVAFTVPSFLLAPIVLAQTDYIAVLPRQMVEMFKQMLDLVAYEPPFPQRKFPLGMLWHQRLSKDPGHLWLRNTLAEVASSIEKPQPSKRNSAKF